MTLPERVRKVLDLIRQAPGRVPTETRTAVFDRARQLAGVSSAPSPVLSPPLGEYVDRVAEKPATVTEQHIAGLQASGLSEDEIFEVTLSAALGAAAGRFERGLDALEET